jgi:hypothetical protein
MRRPDASLRTTTWLVVPLVIGAALCLAPAAQAEPKDAGADAKPSDGPKGTIVGPAAVVQRVIDKRDVSGTNAVAPDGTALGVRLVGVSKYKAGLRDGDIVVSVSGRKTPNVDAIVAAGILAASTGASRLSGRILRGTATYDVVLELPK